VTDRHRPGPYEARLEFTPLLVILLIGCAAISAAWLWIGLVTLGDDPGVLALSLLVVFLFGGNLPSGLIGPKRREPVLRLDEAGVTLGRPPMLFSHRGLRWRLPRTLTVPWSDIEAVVLFTLKTRNSPAEPPFVGLRLRPGVAPPAAEPGPGLMERLNRLLGQEPPPRDVSVYRGIFGWHLDEHRLVAVVRAYAPHVQVLDRDDVGDLAGK
jgi:hypothetical protein